MRIAKIAAAEAYLADIRKLDQRYKAAEVEYRMAVERASGLTGIDYSKDIVQTSPSADAIHNAVERYTELKDQLDAMQAALNDAVDEAFAKIDTLDDTEASVLRMHYLLGIKYCDIARGLAYTEREIYRKRQAGLEHLYDVGLPMQYRINQQQAI